MAQQRKSLVRHNHVPVPFGCDFAHQNGYKSFAQMDKLMDYINSNATYIVFLSPFQPTRQT